MLSFFGIELMLQAKPLKSRVDDALSNEQLHTNFRSAMSYLVEKRSQQFPDKEDLINSRNAASSIRSNSLAKLPELLIKLEENLEKNNIKVHWAETDDEANNIIYQILKEANAKTVAKGKSMVTEEIELNEFLDSKGIDILETDLGEFLVQLANEKPSHIVMPAIHKSRKEISRVFADHFPEFPYTENVDLITQQARKILRDRFRQADAGISGVNFAVAETGTICLVENEGNGRMCTTAPPLHIAVAGIEKVVENLSDVPTLLNILTKSATGQEITTYFNMISSPRKEDEKDGPSSMHVVLLDNGRSKIHQNNVMQETLKCIRCGACINHCPVYTQLGGHAYGTVYPGPIGITLEPQQKGITELGDLTSLCSLCGACGEVCPVQIPLPRLINQLRSETVEGDYMKQFIEGVGSQRKPFESFTWQIWKYIYSNSFLYSICSIVITKLSFLSPKRVGGWSKYRVTPSPSKVSLKQLAKQAGIKNE